MKKEILINLLEKAKWAHKFMTEEDILPLPYSDDYDAFADKVSELKKAIDVAEEDLNEKVKPPEKRTHEIWVEGYQVLDEMFPATFQGDYYGNIFSEAIENWITMRNIDKEKAIKYYNNNWYYLGCQIFDNEEDARKKFG